MTHPRPYVVRMLVFLVLVGLVGFALFGTLSHAFESNPALNSFILLVLGFLDLTAGQAQNRFFNELEEWLAGLTRLSSGALGEGEGSMPVYVQALLEQTAENMENLQHILSRNEEGRVQANQALIGLTERLELLSETMRTNQLLMQRIAEMQAQIVPALQRLSETGTDDVALTHLRNMDRSLQRLLTESEQGRAQSTAELRNDIRILTRTVAARAEEQPR